jgi:ethanolamine ammonia-lyase large subunit
MTERFDFSDLRELFAKANEEKSGDQLAGIAARSMSASAESSA